MPLSSNSDNSQSLSTSNLGSLRSTNQESLKTANLAPPISSNHKSPSQKYSYYYSTLDEVTRNQFEFIDLIHERDKKLEQDKERNYIAT